MEFDKEFDKEIKKLNLEAVIYLPDNAKLNFENNCSLPPIPQYEKRLMVVDSDVVKKIVGGQYGK